MTAEFPYSLQWEAPLPLKRPMGYLNPSNAWLLGPTRVLTANVISIGSTVFAELTNVTDRQTD